MSLASQKGVGVLIVYVFWLRIMSATGIRDDGFSQINQIGGIKVSSLMKYSEFPFQD